MGDVADRLIRGAARVLKQRHRFHHKERRVTRIAAVAK